MNNLYLGIDIGSISSKCVVIDEKLNILASSYIETKGNPVMAIKEILKNVKEELRIKNLLNNSKIVGVGTTGSARNLAGKMVGATVIKNEITAHAIGSMSVCPSVKTIIEIGGQDSKIIIIRDGVVVDYAMNNLCAAGTGAFLSSQAKRLGIDVCDMGSIALSSKNPSKIAARCTVFAESDLVHKLQAGYKREDIIAGLCDSVVLNYLSSVAKGKKIEEPVVFQGGVSKNIGVLESFKKKLNMDVKQMEDGHLLGAYGVAIIALRDNKRCEFDFSLIDSLFETCGIECGGCSNNCSIIVFKKDKKIVDIWGNRCNKQIDRIVSKNK